MEKTITINDIQVDILETCAIGIKHVSIVPVKLSLPIIRPKDEVYLVGSAKLGNRIRKKANPIGFIIKNRKQCSFFSPFPINLSAETLDIVNTIVDRINTWSVYYDFKNNKWPNYLMDDINKREQKAKEQEQQAKELDKLRDNVDDIKNKLNTVKETLDNVCNQD